MSGLPEPVIRDERPDDVDGIRRVIRAAFATVPIGGGNEARIVDALRASHALTLSLVAVDAGRVVGHVAFSPIAIDGRAAAWFDLGPVGVLPDRHGQGIGSALCREGLQRLRAAGAAGCVVVGDPGFYRRLGFEDGDGLRYPGLPPGVLQRIVFTGPAPAGEVAFHAAFSTP